MSHSLLKLYEVEVKVVKALDFNSPIPLDSVPSIRMTGKRVLALIITSQPKPTAIYIISQDLNLNSDALTWLKLRIKVRWKYGMGWMEGGRWMARFQNSELQQPGDFYSPTRSLALSPSYCASLNSSPSYPSIKIQCRFFIFKAFVQDQIHWDLIPLGMKAGIISSMYTVIRACINQNSWPYTLTILFISCDIVYVIETDHDSVFTLVKWDDNIT